MVEEVQTEEKPTTDEECRAKWIKNWSDRMTERYGPVVHERDHEELMGRVLSWEQALCRQIYDYDFTRVMGERAITIPTWSDIKVARSWETGLLPPWIDETRTRKAEDQDVPPPPLPEVEAPPPGTPRENKFCIKTVQGVIIHCPKYYECWLGGRLKTDNPCRLTPPKGD